MRCTIKFSTRPSPDATLKTLWQVERECVSVAQALQFAATVIDRTQPEVLPLVHRIQIQVEAPVPSLVEG